MNTEDFSIAVFPFLKTSGSVRIGGYTFRSTRDVEGLPPDQERAVREIEEMLFVQSDIRVKSASYAILPALEVHSADARLAHLIHLRDVVAFLYAAPHEVSDSVFLSPEEASIVLFTPSRVSVYLTRPEYHTERTVPIVGPKPDRFSYVPGYNGLYNFRHSFWVEPGSRLYGPKPHMTLNITQDLRIDLDLRLKGRPEFPLLLDLLDQPKTPASLRVYSALQWYNAANADGLNQDQAILNLAVAFETLLRLPESSKTDRLVDAIGLLLGRTDRIDIWASQFYSARSRVVHEGEVRDQNFYVGGTTKKHISDIFGSLMLYGRQIFRLCLGTLIVGIDLAQRADLQEKFVSNNERFQKICDQLKSNVGTDSEKLLSLTQTIRALERYRFVSSVIDIGLLITTAQLAASTLAACNQCLPEELTICLAKCAASKREKSEIKRLAAIEALYDLFEKTELPMLAQETRNVRSIIHLVWMSLFNRYFGLKARAEQKES